MGFLIVYKKLISKENYNAFRIRCIMLILEKLINEYNNLIKIHSLKFGYQHQEHHLLS